MTRTEFILQHLKGQIILDIGCAGNDGKLHLKINENRNYVVGLDVDLAGLRKMAGLSSYLVRANAEFLPFPSEKFDSVIIGEVIEHFSCSDKLLGETHRVLKRGGMLCLTTPNAYSIDRMIRYLMTGKDATGQEEHKMLYTPSVLLSLLERFGFKVVSRTTAQKFMFKGLLVSWKIPVFKHLGANLCVSAEKVNQQQSH